MAITDMAHASRIRSLRISSELGLGLNLTVQSELLIVQKRKIQRRMSL